MTFLRKVMYWVMTIMAFINEKVDEKLMLTTRLQYLQLLSHWHCNHIQSHENYTPKWKARPVNTTKLSIVCSHIWMQAECCIYASVNGVTIGSDHHLSPVQHQAIIWTSAGLLLIGSLETNISEIWIKIQQFSYKKCCLQNGGHFVVAPMC